MAVSTGTINKRFISAITFFDQREIEHNVVDIQNEAEFLKIFEGGSDRYVPTSEWDYTQFANSGLFLVGDTTGATIVGSGSAATLTGVTLTAATSGLAMIGTLCLLPNGKSARVSAISTASSQDTLTLVSVDGTNLTLVATNLIAFYGNAQEEESSAPNSNKYDYSRAFNKIQIFRMSDVISDVQKAAKIEAHIGGEDTIMYASHIKKVARLRAEIAATFLVGKMSTSSFSDSAPTGLVGANGNSVQTTRGLDDYVGTSGITATLASAGTVTTPDLQTLVGQLAAKRTPSEFMVGLNTVSYAIWSNYFKGLNSSGIYSGKLMLDGKNLDLNFEGINYAGYSFEFMKWRMLDHAQLFNFTGSAGIQKNAYFIPKGNVGVEGGGSLPHIRVRYIPQPMEGGTGDMIREAHQGLLAPVPIGTQANFRTDWITYQGLEVLGAQHFVKMQIQA